MCLIEFWLCQLILFKLNILRVGPHQLKMSLSLQVSKVLNLNFFYKW